MESNKTILETQKIQVVTVLLNEAEAKQFVAFQQIYPVIDILLKARVFEQKGAAITLHFDKFGQLGNITRADVLFDHRSDFTNSN